MLSTKTREVAMARYHMELSRQDCRFDKTFQLVLEELRCVRDGVSLDGFGFEEYIRAIELFLVPEERRCCEDV